MSSTGIADLKANLSAWLRRVRSGETVTVMDRETPVATIVGIEAAGPAGLKVRAARRSLAGLEQPRRLRTRVDVVDLLLEERGER